MPHYKYLIVGGGMTADAAARGIREVDTGGSIGLIGAEPHAPYSRPPLSKGLWKGRSVDDIWRGTQDMNVSLHLGRRVQSLALQHKRVTDDAGHEYTFDRLLLATGGTPRRLPFDNDGVLGFRTLGDYQRLRALADDKQRFAVIGGGFIGSEIAAALSMNGKEVVMLFPEEGIGTLVFPGDLSRSLNDYYSEKGIDVLAGHSAVGLETRGGHSLLRVRNSRTSAEHTIQVDGVVAGIGIRPATELAEAAGLAVENGVVVDEALHAGHEDVFAAGDVAYFYNPILGKRLRVEHEDNAHTMGAAAGRNMAGESAPYDHLPSFYSDLFDLGYEAVGELDSKLETAADWVEPYRQGVVYYLRDGRVRGVLLWNVWEKVDDARRLIAEPGPFRPQDLKGRL